MKLFAPLLLALSSLLYGACEGYVTLGDRVSKGLEDLPSIVWHAKGKGFTSEPMECQKSGFVLLHDSDKEYSKKEHSQTSYRLQRGWNFVHAPKDGVDVAKTFADLSVLFVYIYEPNTPAWAAYSPHRHYSVMMYNQRILDLKYIEPSLGFYVYATKKIRLPIVSTQLTPSCAELVTNDTYSMLTHSAFEPKPSADAAADISLQTLYKTHYRRGLYTDTRVMLLYPNLETEGKKEAKKSRYAPVEPRAKIEYSKEYAEKKFYLFDYFTKECYEGYFPSKRIPPYPTLKRLK